MEWIASIVLGISVAISSLFGPMLGAPAQETFHKSLVPLADSQYYLGTTSPSTLAWLSAIVDQLCLNGDCRTSWPTGGGGGGSISTSSPGVKGSLLYYTTAAATPELVDPVATTTFTATTPLS